MDVERYKTLILVAEAGNLSTAANNLNYTTSGISRMIAAMEKEMGFPLFIRKHDGVVPTKECEIMLPYIRKFVFSGESCMQMSSEIRRLHVGTINLGTAYNACYSLLTKIIAQFKKQYPGIIIRIKNSYSTELLNLLMDNEIDICLISKREGNFQWTPLCEDEIVAWVPGDSSFAKKEFITLDTFESEPYISILPNLDSDNARLFQKHKIRPNIAFTVMDSAAAYSMVEAGLGITINNRMNGHNLSGNVKAVPLCPNEKVKIGIATLKTGSPLVKTFLDFTKNNS